MLHALCERMLADSGLATPQPGSAGLRVLASLASWFLPALLQLAIRRFGQSRKQGSHRPAWPTPAQLLAAFALRSALLAGTVASRIAGWLGTFAAWAATDGTGTVARASYSGEAQLWAPEPRSGTECSLKPISPSARSRWWQRVLPMLSVLPFLIPLLLLATRPGDAQGLDLSAGGSALEGAGVTAVARQANATSLFSLGFHNGIRIGTARELQRDHETVRWGQGMESLDLPTDLDPAGRQIAVKGIDYQVGTSAGRMRLFAGMRAQPYQTAWASSATSETPLALLAVDHSVSDHLQVHAAAMLGRAGQTDLSPTGTRTTGSALAGISWTANPTLRIAAVAGISGAHPVAAFKTEARGRDWALNASETLGRMQLISPTGSTASSSLASGLDGVIAERTGLNVEAEKQVSERVRVNLARFAFRSPDGSVARIVECGSTLRAAGVVSSLHMLESSDGTNHSRATVVQIGRFRAGGQVSATLLYGDNGFGRSQSVVVEAGRQVSRRIKLSGGVDLAQTAGHPWTPALTGGAEMRLSSGTVSVTHRTVYVPFGPSAGFSRVVAISLRLHPFGNHEISWSAIRGRGIPTLVEGGARTFVELPDGSASPSMASPRHSLARYKVAGRVVDEDGTGIREAAVHVGSETIYTGPDGSFEARIDRPRAVAVEAAPAEFLTPVRYQTLSMPLSVTPSATGAAPLLLTVQRSRASASGGDRAGLKAQGGLAPASSANEQERVADRSRFVAEETAASAGTESQRDLYQGVRWLWHKLKPW